MEETPSLCVQRQEVAASHSEQPRVGSQRHVPGSKPAWHRRSRDLTSCFSLVSSRRDTALVPSPSCACVLGRLLQENWIRKGSYCKLSHCWGSMNTYTVSSPSLYMLLPPPLHPSGSSSLHQLQQGRRECSLSSRLLCYEQERGSIYWKQTSCEEKLDSW